jgi:hypothetical protein
MAKKRNMAESRLERSVRNLGGKVQEGVAGTAQDVYGQAADATRTGAANLDHWVRDAIETQPYKAALVALGIGWLLGRLHRPI